MNAHRPRNPAFADRVRDSFQRQAFMRAIGAELSAVAPGRVEIRLPHQPHLMAADGGFDRGVIGTLADNAGGYAAFTLLPADWSVLTAEFKVNLLGRADGDELVARSRVVGPGPELVVCRSDVFVRRQSRLRRCAAALVTLAGLPGRSDQASGGGRS